MAYNTVSIIKDVDGKPVPQYYNQLQNTYEVLKGRNGANYVEILGPNGETLSIVDNKLAVRATEIEARLQTLETKIDQLLLAQDENNNLKVQQVGSMAEEVKIILGEG